MATKTLGIKFEIAGVKEAQAGLKTIRDNLNASLRANKEAVKQSLKFSGGFRKKSVVGEAEYPSSAASVSSESRKENYNSIVRLDDHSIKAIATALIGLGGGGFSGQSDPISEIKNKGLIRGSVSSAGNNIRSVYKGFLESIGAGLGQDFGDGLKKALEEDLDFSFRRRGEVTGKTAAYTISEGGRGLRKELGILLQLVRKTNVKETTPKEAAENANEVRKSLVRLFSLLPTKLATGYRRSSVQLEGLPRVDKLRNRDENKANNFKHDTKDVIYSFGGFAGKEGKAGFENAELLKKYTDLSTEVVGMNTQFTDLTVNAKKTTQWVIEALGTVASINVKGFNPDAIKGAAKIINDLDANPDIQAKILGHSAGGFPAEEIVQILNLTGYGERVSGISVGTPNMKGRLEAPNFTRVMGEGDKIMRGFEQGIDPVGLFADDAEILEGVHGHGFKDYLGSERFLELVLGERVQSLIEQYQKYLKNIATQASAEAQSKVDTLIPGYKDFSVEQKKNASTELAKNVLAASKRYRKAVKDQDLKLARELGENLLAQIQYLRKIYGDILTDGGKDRSISGKLGNLTKIETEVIVGQPNLESQGFDKKGLVHHLGDQLNGEAGFVVDGFVEGIQAELDRVKEAGENIGDSLQDGTDENLGIASPAKRYIIKGKQVVEGFVKGIRGKVADAAAAGKNLGDAAAKGTANSNIAKGFDSARQGADNLLDRLGDRFPILNKFNRILLGVAVKSKARSGFNSIKDSANSFFDALGDRLLILRRFRTTINEVLPDNQVDQAFESTKNKLDEFFSTIESQFPSLKRFRRILFGIAGLFIAKLGLDFIVGILKKVGRESLSAAMAMESLNLSILFASRNALDGAAALEFISASAKQLSIDLLSAKNQYSGLLAAARNTPLEGEQINRVFNAFAETAANRGLNAGQQQRVFTALEQIINKRYLGREEVVGQLGDVFSGFEGLLSETLGVSSSQLGKMMESKQVGLDVLPKVAAALEAQNAALGSIDTAQKAMTRFNNAVLESKVALGEILQPLQKFVLNLGTKAVEDLSGKLLFLFKVILATGAVSLLTMFGQVNLITLATNLWNTSVKALNLSLNKLNSGVLLNILKTGSLIVAEYLLIAAAFKTVTNLIDLSKNQYQSIKDDVVELRAEVDRYRQAVEKANGVQQELGNQNKNTELKAGWKLPDNRFGDFLRPIVGGAHFNLDNLVRKRINWFGEQYTRYHQFIYDKTGQNIQAPDFKILTEQERRQSDFAAETGDLISEIDGLLQDSQNVFKAAEKITELDQDIAEIQNKREFLLAGDKEGIEKSLSAERKISSTRDEQVKILTAYQQSANSTIAKIKNALEKLELGNFDPQFKQAQKNHLNDRLDATEAKLKNINNLLSIVRTILVEEKKKATH